MAGEQVFQYQDATPVEMLPGVVRRTLAQNADMQIVEIRLEAGSEIPTHSHFNHQAEYLVSGEMVMTIDGVDYPCKAGDSWVVPGNMEHSARMITDVVIIANFSPARDDYK